MPLAAYAAHAYLSLWPLMLPMLMLIAAYADYATHALTSSRSTMHSLARSTHVAYLEGHCSTM